MQKKFKIVQYNKDREKENQKTDRKTDFMIFIRRVT